MYVSAVYFSDVAAGDVDFGVWIWLCPPAALGTLPAHLWTSQAQINAVAAEPWPSPKADFQSSALAAEPWPFSRAKAKSRAFVSPAKRKLNKEISVLISLSQILARQNVESD